MSGRPSVMPELLTHGLRAMEICRHLVVEIGPRPAGSPAEGEALTWIEETATQLGYTVQTEGFAFAPQPPFLPYQTLAALGMLAGAVLLPVFPWAALALPLWVAALPELADGLQRRLPHREKSANLVVLPGGTTLDQVELLFCAHVDSARAVPNQSSLIRSLRPHLHSLMQRTALILAIVGLVNVSGLFTTTAFNTAALTFSLLIAAGLIAFDLYNQLGNHLRFSPGANDNASGTAVLVTLMETLASQPPEKVGYLFTGAEETGMDGARAFVHQHPLPGTPPFVLSVDMVGTGQRLRIIREARSLHRVITSTALNRLLERADPAAQPHTAVRRSGDFEPFLKAGFPASAIEAEGTQSSWGTNHTSADQGYDLDPAMLEHTCQVCIQLVHLVGKNPPSSLSNPKDQLTQDNA